MKCFSLDTIGCVWHVWGEEDTQWFHIRETDRGRIVLDGNDDMIRLEMSGMVDMVNCMYFNFSLRLGLSGDRCTDKEEWVRDQGVWN